VAAHDSRKRVIADGQFGSGTSTNPTHEPGVNVTASATSTCVDETERWRRAQMDHRAQTRQRPCGTPANPPGPAGAPHPTTTPPPCRDDTGPEHPGG